MNEFIIPLLSLTFLSFGGPAAHIALFHERLVVKERWLSESRFTELFAISQSLPGPASTQLIYAICLLHSGIRGGIFGFLLWSLPGALFMFSVAYSVDTLNNNIPAWLQYIVNGLSSSALGLVALAAYKLSLNLFTDTRTMIVGLISGSLAINFNVSWLYPFLVFMGGLVILSLEFKTIDQSLASGLDDEENEMLLNQQDTEKTISGNIGIASFSIWIFCLASFFILGGVIDLSRVFHVLSTHFGVGSLIFGGGPVVIPLLQKYVVDSEMWLSNQEFLFGLAVINSIPGPNFNLAVYCGALALRASRLEMVGGGILAWIGIFLPGLLLMTAVIPLWASLRKISTLKTFLRGVNAAACGLVFAAVYFLSLKAIVLSSGDSSPIFFHPLYTSVAVFSFVLTGFTSAQPHHVVFFGALTGLVHYLCLS